MPNNKKVIPFPQSSHWRFFDWMEAGGSNPIQEWLDDQSDEVQMTFNSILKDAQKRRNHLEWPSYRHKMRDLEGIHELGFKVEGKQFRLLIKFDGAMQTVILCGCYHKMDRYTPTDALATADRRARALSSGKATKHERTIETDF